MGTNETTNTTPASQMAPDDMRGLAARLRARADSVLMRDCSHQQADLRAAAGLIERLADLNAEIMASGAAIDRLTRLLDVMGGA
jgi:hypothetical protein